MTPKKLPFVRLTGRVLVGLSLLSLFVVGSNLLVHVLSVWQPEWNTNLPRYQPVYDNLTAELAARLPWMLFAWLSITVMAISIWMMGHWPARANLVRG